LTPSEFTAFLDQLARAAESSPHVVGLVGFGSTAHLQRADEGSDHDFAWLTVKGAEDSFRHDLTWLPDHERIAASALEWHGGVKVVYEDGHRLEFGIADVESFSSWAGGPAHVYVGDDRVREATAAVVARRPHGVIDPVRELVLFHTQLLSGIGRELRGETLSASGLVRGEAVEHLLTVIAAVVPSDSREQGSRLDPLDPRRRFDAAYPAAAHEIEVMCRSDVLTAASLLLEFAHDVLAAHLDYPQQLRGIVRARLFGPKALGRNP
jgi:hypothetical protein